MDTALNCLYYNRLRENVCLLYTSSLLAKYSMPAIVIDLGTATTISALDRNGCYVGSSIAPGIRLGLDALTEGTAQLPQIGLETPVPVIGTNTGDLSLIHI